MKTQTPLVSTLCVAVKVPRQSRRRSEFAYNFGLLCSDGLLLLCVCANHCFVTGTLLSALPKSLAERIRSLRDLLHAEAKPLSGAAIVRE